MTNPAHPTLPPTTPIEEMAAALDGGLVLQDAGDGNPPGTRWDTWLVAQMLAAARQAGWTLVRTEMLEDAADSLDDARWNEIASDDPDAIALATALRQAAATTKGTL